jgi:bacteriocin-like protein
MEKLENNEILPLKELSEEALSLVTGGVDTVPVDPTNGDSSAPTVVI